MSRKNLCVMIKLSSNVSVPTSLDKSYAQGIDTVVMTNVFVASADVKHNAEKEEKAKQERKQRQLEAVEQNGIP